MEDLQGFFFWKNMSTIEIKNISICRTLRCSACCRDIDIRLTKEEVLFLQNAGTNIKKVSLIGNMSFSGGSWGVYGAMDGRKYFHIEGVCGNLSNDGLCNSYEDPERPKACEQLKPGKEFLNGCNGIRTEKGE